MPAGDRVDCPKARLSALVHGKGTGANSVTSLERKKRDRRIIRQRANGASVRDIAKSEGMTVNGTFLALKRLEPQLVTALKR